MNQNYLKTGYGCEKVVNLIHHHRVHRALIPVRLVCANSSATVRMPVTGTH